MSAEGSSPPERRYGPHAPDRLATFGTFVDRLVNTDIQTRLQHFGLYDAARLHADGQPVCLSAAECIVRSLKPGSNIAVFTTGFYSPAYWCGEQDGPVGVACLARALETSASVRSIILTDAELVGEVADTCIGAGFKVFDLERLLTVPKGRGIAVVPVSKNASEAGAVIAALYDRVTPSFVMAVERPSGNAKGEYHNLRGLNMTAITGKTDAVLVEANRRGIPTIGVGDGGNELGYGAIEAAVESVRPNGARCQCPCGGTVASHIAADVVVHSAVSNWGVYGIMACLAVLLDTADAAPSESVVSRAIAAAAAAGSDDGRLGWVDPGADGVDARFEVAIAGLLRTMAQELIQLAAPARKPVYGVGDG